MPDLSNPLLKILCTGLGEGNSNTDKLTNEVLKSNPEKGYNKTKSEVVESLRELKDTGQIQILTIGWELGEEFLFVCSKRL